MAGPADGAVFRRLLLRPDGTPLLAAVGALGLFIFFDYYEPFDNTTYCIGVIVAFIANLPADVRYKKENRILWGLIPGPSQHSIEPYVSILQQQLQQGYEGIDVKTSEGDALKIPIVALAVGGDSPACRKLIGYVSHNSLIGCSKGTARFHSVSDGFKADGTPKSTVVYGGIRNCPDKNPAEWRRRAFEYRLLPNAISRKKAAKLYGVRYSPFLELAYFNPVDQHLLDVMHLAFIGVAAFLVKLWQEKGYLPRSVVEKLKETMKRVPLCTTRSGGNFGRAFRTYSLVHLFSSCFCLFSFLDCQSCIRCLFLSSLIVTVSSCVCRDR